MHILEGVRLNPTLQVRQLVAVVAQVRQLALQDGQALPLKYWVLRQRMQVWLARIKF